MGYSGPTQLLMIPPPIHTDDTGSPPPGSILLDPYGYHSCRINGTTAWGSTRDGKTILVTFWAASPPRVSCFTIYAPDLKPSDFGRLPKAIYSEDDLVLLRVPICSQKDSLRAPNNHYFVYQAGTENIAPSLKLVPIPPDLLFGDSEVALLRCREQDMFYFALLHRVVRVNDGEYYGRQFNLHLYNSKTGRWNTESMHVDSQDFSYSYTSIVLAMGGEFGSVGWVDLWRGILICDLLRDNLSLRYIPLPLPLVPKPLKGYPLYIRNIIVLEDYIKFFEMHYVRPGSTTGGTCGSEGLVAATKKMKISDIGSGNSNWEEDCAIKFSDIPVDSLKFAQVLLNLKQINGTKLTLKRLHAGYPALSLHDADVVYVMHTPDPDEDKAFVIAVDMRNKTLIDVADFGSGRPLGYTFTYLQSGISKHLNVWSSSRNISWRNDCETSRDGDHASLKIKERVRAQTAA